MQFVLSRGLHMHFFASRRLGSSLSIGATRFARLANIWFASRAIKVFCLSDAPMLLGLCAGRSGKRSFAE